MSLTTDANVTLFSNHRELERGFDRIKNQALQWVFDEAPAGPTYEAALPGREAFCMRDTAHQCIGAEVLGLHRHNLNMMRWFAKIPSEKTDWCSWWEIDRYGRPCPVDYAGDDDFWYNLPANFDILDAIYRLYRFSGDSAYLNDPELRRFGAVTLENYIRAWDRDGDGIPDRVLSEGRRGLCSYDESDFSSSRLKVGLDLMVIQARGLLSAAELYAHRDQRELARITKRRAQKILDRIEALYDPEKGFPVGIDFDDQPLFTQQQQHVNALLYYQALPQRLSKQYAPKLAGIVPQLNIEGASHVSETLFRYGRYQEGYDVLLAMMDPNLHRREYPEASFASVGATAMGLMGIEADAPQDRIATLSGLPEDVECELLHVPTCATTITVQHLGQRKSRLTNEGNRQIAWRAQFRGEGKIEGQDGRVAVHPLTGEPVTWTELLLQPGQSAACRFIPN